MKSKILVGVVLLLTAYAFGRWSAPEKIKIETKIVEVDKKVDDTKSDTNRDKHKTTTVTEIVRPDGTKETTTTTSEDTETHKTSEGHSAEERETESASLKEVTRATQKTTLSVLYGMPFTGGVPVYGGSVTRGILGPICIGGFALTSGVVGVSLGLQF